MPTSTDDGAQLLKLLSRPILRHDASWLPESAWHQHIPFAFLAIDLLRPRTFVELGTQKGASYCAFCEASVVLKHDMQAWAVDHWGGDQHSGAYDPSTYDALRAYHDPKYGRFSKLMRMTFDDAISHFSEGSIDLLHMDGFHTYEAVRHDFETWLPKLSKRAVVLMHDTEVREREFGVWRLMDELAHKYPFLAIPFGYGLGVLMVGPEIPTEFLALSKFSDTERMIFLESLQTRGERIEYRHGRDVLSTQLESTLEREKYLYATYLDYRKSADLVLKNAELVLQDLNAQLADALKREQEILKEREDLTAQLEKVSKRKPAKRW